MESVFLQLLKPLLIFIIDYEDTFFLVLLFNDLSISHGIPDVRERFRK